MDEMKSKVYIQIDSENRITRCEGGYTMNNIEDIFAWTLIDEGVGDRYNLCQTQYFEPPLYTEDGICRWKCTDGKTPVLRSTAEIDADRAAIPPPPPSDHELLMTLLGVLT